VRSVPDLRTILNKTFGFDPKAKKPKYRMVGGLVLAYPLDYWRQGGPESEKIGQKRIQHLAVIPVYVDENNGVIRVPVIGGNSVFGIMKNNLSEYMFEWYRNNEPDKLKLIYYEKPESVIMAALFRMKMPFVPVKRPPLDLYNAVWENFIWRTWGIGMAGWAPQKAFTATSLIPTIVAGSARIEVARYYAEKLGLDINDALSTIKTVSEDELKVEIIKLRHPLSADYSSIGVVPASNEEIFKWLKETGFIKEKEKESENEKQSEKQKEFTLLEPVPINIEVAPANTPLLALIVQKNAMKLFNDMEVATVAHAVRSLCVVGPKENTFKLVAGVAFKNVYTGETLVLKKVTYGSCGENAEESEELVRYSEMFADWVRDSDYPVYIHEVGLRLIEAVKREKKQKKQKGEKA